MLPWTIESTDEFERSLKRYQKKHPAELAAVLNNLDTYFKAVEFVEHPLQVTGGYIHNEPKGIIAIDQRGGGRKTKLKVTRLYVYSDAEKRILYVLTIGDKQSQAQDIKNCKEKVKKLKRDNS
jgi:hypothetical protein